MTFYKSGEWPEDCYTRSQLRKMGLKPKPEASPVGWWHRMCYHLDVPLFRKDDCEPIICTPRQREALEKAWAAMDESDELAMYQRGILESYKDCLIELYPLHGSEKSSKWGHFNIHLPSGKGYQGHCYSRYYQRSLKYARYVADWLLKHPEFDNYYTGDKKSDGLGITLYKKAEGKIEREPATV